MEALPCVILAGGRGSRLGGRLKANVRLGGRSLLQHVVERLQDCSPLLLSIGFHDAGQFPGIPSHMLVPDSADWHGPLAGIVAAANWCSQQSVRPPLLLSVAVDAPFIPRDFAQRAYNTMDRETAAVIARWKNQVYPTHCLWRLQPLCQALKSIPHSAGLAALQQRLVQRQVVYDDEEDPFAGVNTPEDLAAALLRSISSPGESPD